MSPEMTAPGVETAEAIAGGALVIMPKIIDPDREGAKATA